MRGRRSISSAPSNAPDQHEPKRHIAAEIIAAMKDAALALRKSAEDLERGHLQQIASHQLRLFPQSLHFQLHHSLPKYPSCLIKLSIFFQRVIKKKLIECIKKTRI